MLSGTPNALEFIPYQQDTGTVKVMSDVHTQVTLRSCHLKRNTAGVISDVHTQVTLRSYHFKTEHNLGIIRSACMLQNKTPEIVVTTTAPVFNGYAVIKNIKGAIIFITKQKLLFYGLVDLPNHRLK